MPKPIAATSIDQFRLRPEPEATADRKPSSRPAAAPPLTPSAQMLVNQQGKPAAKTAPNPDAEVIARELSKQAGIDARATPPKATYQPLPAGARHPSAARPPAPDCTTQAVKTAGTCAVAVVAAGAGVATGPGELAALAVGGAMCAAEIIDYYRCIQVIKP